MSTEQKTVRMSRDQEQFPAPHSADVHPDEVANFQASGWVEEAPAEAATSKRSKKVAAEATAEAAPPADEAQA